MCAIWHYQQARTCDHTTSDLRIILVMIRRLPIAYLQDAIRVIITDGYRMIPHIVSQPKTVLISLQPRRNTTIDEMRVATAITSRRRLINIDIHHRHTTNGKRILHKGMTQIVIRNLCHPQLPLI